MTDIPSNHMEHILVQTKLKTVDQYVRMKCRDCDRFLFMTLFMYKEQIADISDNNWKCPKCDGHNCVVDFSYAYRMLVN